MPEHVATAFLTVGIVPLAAAITCTYALSRNRRIGLTIAALVASVSAVGVVSWAAGNGSQLMSQVKRAGASAEIEAASVHANGSANLAYAVIAMLLLVLVAAAWTHRPGRDVTISSRVTSVLLVLSSAASIVALWMVAEAGMRAAWM